MNFNLEPDTPAGELYVTKEDKVYQLKRQGRGHYANIVTGRQIGGVVGSPNQHGFKKLEECDKDQLISIVQHLAQECQDEKEKMERQNNQAFAEIARTQLAEIMADLERLADFKADLELRRKGLPTFLVT
jgi:hypothetical protein